MVKWFVIGVLRQEFLYRQIKCLLIHLKVGKQVSLITTIACVIHVTNRCDLDRDPIALLRQQLFLVHLPWIIEDVWAITLPWPNVLSVMYHYREENLLKNTSAIVSITTAATELAVINMWVRNKLQGSKKELYISLAKKKNIIITYSRFLVLLPLCWYTSTTFLYFSPFNHSHATSNRNHFIYSLQTPSK